MKRHVLRPLAALVIIALFLFAVSTPPTAWLHEAGAAADGAAEVPASGVASLVGAADVASTETAGLTGAGLVGDTTPAALQLAMNPGDEAPRITLPTLGGEVSFGGAPDDESYVLLGYSELSDYSKAVWSASATRLIRYSPDDVNYVFMSYGETQEEVDADITGIKQRIDDAIGKLMDEGDRQHWTEHFHYVSANPLTLDSPVPEFLMAWGTRLAFVDAEWVGEGGVAAGMNEIGTTDNGWARSLTETGPITRHLAWYGGKACGSAVPDQDPTDLISLIERGDCAFSEKTANAEKHGAVATLIFTDPDRPKGTMGANCGDDCPDIPVVMIDRDPGLDLVDELVAGNTVTATLTGIQIGVESMAVNQLARVREFGSIPFPFNEHLTTPIDNFEMIAYESEHMSYEHGRDSRLASEEAAGEVTVLPVFEGEWADDPDWAGKRSYADVELPDAATMATFDTLELDLAIGCEDNRKANCPDWDYLIHMYLCDADDPEKCGTEIGRWITPYWSGGRWVTDVSPMLGYLAEGGVRRFAFQTQQRYLVDLSLRLSNREKGTTGKRAFDLGWTGGAFWNEYNKLFHPIEFEMPEWAEKVELMSYVTGHGGGKDKENCAEFCNHTHHFSINGGEDHVREHPEASTLMGCAQQVGDGVVPNQGGTWIFGRGGWCPGLDVKPWVVDITDEVVKGELNELTYRGLFDGKDYVPEKGPGQPDGYDARIRLRTFLVYSAGEDVAPGPVQPPYSRVPGLIYMPSTLNRSAQ